jgi:hypothetical protein
MRRRAARARLPNQCHLGLGLRLNSFLDISVFSGAGAAASTTSPPTGGVSGIGRLTAAAAAVSVFAGRAGAGAVPAGATMGVVTGVDPAAAAGALSVMALVRVSWFSSCTKRSFKSLPWSLITFKSEAISSFNPSISCSTDGLSATVSFTGPPDLGTIAEPTAASTGGARGFPASSTAGETGLPSVSTVGRAAMAGSASGVTICRSAG